MTRQEEFSLEKYAAEWQKSQDTVVVEGTVQEDGSFFVIDPDPCQLGLVVRVRKEDVTDKRESRKVQCQGKEHQLYFVSIKKNVPIAREMMALSDQIVPSVERIAARPLLLASPQSVEVSSFAEGRFADVASERTLIWNATHGAIGHNRGEVYSGNSSYWIDRTRTNDRWTCYGPYVDLSPGRYRATWGITLGVSCPPMLTARNYWVVELDVVADINTPRPNRTLWGPKGVTWATACDETGNVAAEFDVPAGVTQIEVRLRKRKWADYLIAKFLLIERI